MVPNSAIFVDNSGKLVIVCNGMNLVYLLEQLRLLIDNTSNLNRSRDLPHALSLCVQDYRLNKTRLLMRELGDQYKLW